MTILRYLRTLLLRGRLDDEAREELRHHVEAFVAERMAAGATEAEARRLARIELGDLEPVAEELASARPGAALDALRQDLRLSARGLRRSAGFSVLCILLVALGVGASTTLFTLVERVLLRPLPYPAPDRLVRLFETSPEAGVDRTGVSRGSLAAWRKEARRFDGMAVGYAMGRTLSDGDRSEVVLAAQVTCDFFPLLGARLAHGRAFTADECRRATYNNAAAPDGPSPVVVLGPGLWARRFGSDPEVVGRTVTIERRSYEVVGVLAEEVSFPWPGSEAFLAWELERSLPFDQRYGAAVARVRPGVEIAAAAEELRALAARVASERPETNRGWSVAVAPLQEDATAASRPVLLVLFAASGLVLLVACGNAAILFFARGQARAREAALRLALGAPRRRVLREGLVDATLLAAAGGLLGAGIAALAVRAVPALWPDLPRAADLRLDGTALGFAVLASLAAALLAGALPAWRVARTDPRAALDDGARGTAGRPAQAARDALVVAEIALTVALLAGAGLLVRSVTAMQSTDPGFDPEGVLVAPVFLDNLEYDSGSDVRQYYSTLFERLGALPGVEAVGGATTLPASPLGPDFQRPVWPDGLGGEHRSRRMAWIRMITTGYLDVMRIPVVEGRGFSSEDVPGGRPVLAVSETLARELWPEGEAVGRHLVVDYASAGTYPYEVVGVFGDVLVDGPRGEPRAEVYFPHAQRSYLVLNVALRHSGGSPTLPADVRRVLHDLDPQKPAYGVHRLEDLQGATFTRERRAMQLLVGFAAVACLLSGLGVYGMLAYRVRQRAPEIGVRVALGATRSDIAGWMAREGVRLVARGAALGILFAAFAGRLLESLLFEVDAADPLTAGGVLAVLALTGGFAILVPAWRAARLEPSLVLRRG